ncbi:MAG: enoyl-CoA hydratase/isomerase family protein [Acidimicrobiales bacterium]
MMVRSGVLEVKAAAELLRRAKQGSAETLGMLAGRPLLVVDLDSEGDLSSLELFPSFPGVVVGIGDRVVGRVPLPDLDVCLTGSIDAPAPWVGVGNLGAGLDLVCAATARCPMAAVTLTQVLRMSGRHGLGGDLIAESLAYSSLQGGPEFSAWLAAGGRRPGSRPAGLERVVMVERSGDRLDVTLSRPAVRNAYSSAMRDQLCEALSVVCADPSIGEVHLHGEGTDFCSGGDLAEFGTLDDPTTAHLVRTTRSAARLLGVVGDRVVAHLHGACVGAGIELPAFAHRVVATPDARLSLPELAMGLIPGAGGTASLPRRIGRHRTTWMALSGQFVDAATAQRWGLVDEVGPA